MTTESEIERRFQGLGGVFLTPAAAMAARLPVIRALLYDWDGVFNIGMKGESIRSSFSEPDSMGSNMLRYALWRAQGRMPVCAIISGEYNPTARQFAMREHFHEVYTGMMAAGHVGLAVRKIVTGIQPNRVLIHNILTEQIILLG